MTKQPNNLGDLLLRKGAIEGPFRRTKPLTVGLCARILRALRAWNINRRTPR